MNRPTLILLIGILLSCISSSGCEKSQPTVPTNQEVSEQMTSAEDTLNVGSEPTITFDDETFESGINHEAKSGYEADLFTMLEFVGSGVSVIDFDYDGLQDLIFSGGGYFPESKSIAGYSCRLYQATAPFKFREVSLKAAVDGSTHYNHGIFVEDIDADGFEDLLITGYGGIQVYFNQGDGTFVLDHGPRTPIDANWSTAACFGDVNQDGLVDLYVAHYGNWSLENNPACFGEVDGQKIRKACAPEAFPGIDDHFFFLNADGTFIDSTKEVGLSPQGRGLGIVSADLDLDGDIDFYVANDECENFLYINEQGSKLSERGIQNGCAVDANGQVQGSMGVAIGDFQGDLKTDIFVTNFTNELCALYTNRSKASFRFQSPQAGIKILGPDQVSWGTAFQDFDRDGDEDLMIVSGHVDRLDEFHKQLPTILQNDQSRFNDKTASAGEYFRGNWAARALALFDHDGDGNMDCAISHLDEPSHLLRNTTQSIGDYLYVRLIGTRSNRNAIGSIVRSKDSNGHEQLRHRFGGGSYMATSDKVLTFTAPKSAKSESMGLTVTWPSGQVSELSQLAWNQSITIIEPMDDNSEVRWFRN